MIQLIFSDLENAMLNSSYEIAPANGEAIEAARAKGKHVVVFTSRNKQRVGRLSEQSHIKCDKIFMNGALAEDENGRCLQEVFMEPDTVREVADFLLQSHIRFICDTDRGLFGSHEEPELSRVYADCIVAKQIKKNAKAAMPMIKNNRFFSGTVKLNSAEELNGAKVYRFEAFAANPAELSEAERKFKAMSSVAFHDLDKHEFTLTDAKATFGAMIQKFINATGMNVNDTLIISGSRDCLSVFEQYPNCCAIENSDPALMAKASTAALNAAKAIYTAISNDTKAERDRNNAREDARIARREANKARRRAEYRVENGIATEEDLALLEEIKKNDEAAKQRREAANSKDDAFHGSEEFKKKPFRKDGFKRDFKKDGKREFKKDGFKKNGFKKNDFKKDTFKKPQRQEEAAAGTDKPMFAKPVRRKKEEQ